MAAILQCRYLLHGFANLFRSARCNATVYLYMKLLDFVHELRRFFNLGIYRMENRFSSGIAIGNISTDNYTALFKRKSTQHI